MSGAPGPGPEFSIKRFPIDSRLAFFRVVVSHEAGIDRVATLVEMLQQRLTDVTSEMKTTLKEDGTAFIMAFLADKQFMTKGDMAAFCGEVAKEHARLSGIDQETE